MKNIKLITNPMIVRMAVSLLFIIIVTVIEAATSNNMAQTNEMGSTSDRMNNVIIARIMITQKGASPARYIMIPNDRKTNADPASGCINIRAAGKRKIPTEINCAFNAFSCVL